MDLGTVQMQIGQSIIWYKKKLSAVKIVYALYTVLNLYSTTIKIVNYKEQYQS